MNSRKLLLFTFSMLLFSSVFFVACDEEDDQVSNLKLVADYDAEAALKWNDFFLVIERYADGYRPGPAPRALGLMALASYEACVTAMPDYNSLENQFNGLNIPNIESGKEYHWPTVVHAVYSIMMPNFFDGSDPSPHPASVQDQWDVLVSSLNQKYEAEAGTEVFNRSKTYGEAVGLAVWEWSTTDTYGHNAYKAPFGNYNTNEFYHYGDHYDGPGDWVPTAPPGPIEPMGPFYGKARAFVLSESEKLCLPPSYYYMDYSEDIHSEYYAQAMQAYTKNAATDYNVEWIGEFWSDDLFDLTFSPGPRWIAIANQVIDNENANLELALETYGKVGLAVSDAAVGAWASKFHYNVERPLTYIRKVIDPTYKSNLDNPITGAVGFVPPFPAYPSGHSTMGGAGAEALASVWGYNYSMTDNCHLGRTEFEGVPRTFPSFKAMADENAWSRVLLGTHWLMDCVEGVRYGEEIARQVNALPWKK